MTNKICKMVQKNKTCRKNASNNRMNLLHWKNPLVIIDNLSVFTEYTNHKGHRNIPIIPFQKKKDMK